MRILASSSLLIFSTLFTGAVYASQTCSGNWTNTNTIRDKIDLGDGITMTTSINKGSLTSQNSKQQGIGACTNVTISYPDGTFRSFYVCARRGENGVFVDHGGMKPKAKNGTWNVDKGTGTGDYKNLSAKGSYKIKLIDDAVAMGTFEGKCKY